MYIYFIDIFFAYILIIFVNAAKQITIRRIVIRKNHENWTLM